MQWCCHTSVGRSLFALTQGWHLLNLGHEIDYVAMRQLFHSTALANGSAPWWVIGVTQQCTTQCYADHCRWLWEGMGWWWVLVGQVGGWTLWSWWCFPSQWFYDAVLFNYCPSVLPYYRTAGGVQARGHAWLLPVARALDESSCSPCTCLYSVMKCCFKPSCVQYDLFSLG